MNSDETWMNFIESHPICFLKKCFQEIRKKQNEKTNKLTIERAAHNTLNLQILQIVK